MAKPVKGIGWEAWLLGHCGCDDCKERAMANETIDGSELVRLHNKAVKDRAALLGALELVIERVEDMRAQGREVPVYMWLAVDKARAAIAQAKGQA